MTQLHIAILDCDPLTSTICKKYGSYGGVIINWLQAGARGLSMDFGKIEVSVWNVMEDEYPNVEEVDALIITGSRQSFC